MKTLTEGALQRYTQDACRREGIACYKFASPSRRGVPDLMLIYDGRVVFVELKSPTKTGKLSALQHHELTLLTSHGAEVYVIDSYEDADTIINDLRFNTRANRHGRPTLRLRPYLSNSSNGKRQNCLHPDSSE